MAFSKRDVRFFEILRRHRAYTLLRIDAIRIFIVKWRKKRLLAQKDSLKIWNGTREHLQKFGDGRNTLEYNLEGMHDLSGARGMRIIRPLASIETYRPLSEMPGKGGLAHDLDYQCDAKVLVIGPRTEGEIFSLIAYGFTPENIRGLDLFSYSPFVDVGDMHAMPYADNEFDIVIASCVLVYSVNPKQACSEILRVTKPQGLVCISQDTVPSAGEAAKPILGKAILSCNDYLEQFEGNVDKIFFQHELPERLREPQSGEGSNYTMNLIFRIRK